MSPHSSDTEQEDTGDRATRAREGGLRTFFERRRVDGTRLALAVETTLFRRPSSESAFDDPFDREEAPRRTLISQGFAALRRSRAREEAFDAVDALDRDQAAGVSCGGERKDVVEPLPGMGDRRPVVTDEGELKFIASVELAPEFGELDLAKLEITRHVAEVADADVERMLENLRQLFAKRTGAAHA